MSIYKIILVFLADLENAATQLRGRKMGELKYFEFLDS